MNVHAYAYPIELKSGEDDADPAAVVTKALTDFQAALDAKSADTEAKLAKIAADLARVEAKANRPGIAASNDNEPPVEKKAFEAFMRRGTLDTKNMIVSTDSSGGFLAPTQFAAEIIRLLRLFSPIRQYAKVLNIGGPSIKIPRRVGSTAATWVGETAARTASEMSFEQLTFTPYELATYTDVSTQLLEDNAYNLEEELASNFAESFAIAEGYAFVKGTGAGQPKGLLTASGIAEVKTGAASAFPASNPADVIIGMYHALPGVFAQNAVWMMNRTTLGIMRQWKQTTGEYLLVDPVTATAPVTILGRPVVEAVDMPDIGAGAYPLLFGDLSSYRIIDRVGLSILRDPFSLATTGQVRFHARKRVGADVTNPDRIVKLKVSA